jgi:hypothetical protein
MAQGIDFFNTVNYLDPKCPSCGTKIDWGVSTEYCDETEGQICKKCGNEIPDMI